MAGRRGTRYYSDDDFEKGVTRSQLKRLGHVRQIEYMLHWFGRNFEDPANETPYNSEEGGYLYIWGGPYDAAEELFDEFGDIVPETRIQEVIDEVEREGLTDWAPGPDHPDHERAREEWADENREDDQEDSPLQQMLKMLEGGIVPRFGGSHEREQRREILSRLDELEAHLEILKPAHGGIGHNHPPEDETVVPTIEEAQTATTEIRGELLKEVPDALVVARATSRLQTAIGWLLKKADMAADSFAKSLGDGTGKAAALVVGAYATSKVFPGLAKSGSDVLSATTDWLHTITWPF